MVEKYHAKVYEFWSKKMHVHVRILHAKSWYFMIWPIWSIISTNLSNACVLVVTYGIEIPCKGIWILMEEYVCACVHITCKVLVLQDLTILIYNVHKSTKHMRFGSDLWWRNTTQRYMNFDLRICVCMCTSYIQRPGTSRSDQFNLSNACVLVVTHGGEIPCKCIWFLI